MLFFYLPNDCKCFLRTSAKEKDAWDTFKNSCWQCWVTGLDLLSNRGYSIEYYCNQRFFMALRQVGINSPWVWFCIEKPQIARVVMRVTWSLPIRIVYSKLICSSRCLQVFYAINVIAAHRHCAHKEVPADWEVLVLKGTVFIISQGSPKEIQAKVFRSKGSRTPILVWLLQFPPIKLSQFCVRGNSTAQAEILPCCY